MLLWLFVVCCFVFFVPSSQLPSLSTFFPLLSPLFPQDLFMPVMDGGECCAQIRKLPGGANVPIIGVTAHDDPKVIFI